MARAKNRAAHQARDRRAGTPHSAAHHEHPGHAMLLQLQRQAGNRAVSRLLTGAHEDKGSASSAPITIQRVKDAFDYKLDKGTLALATPFTDKHVAADAAAAKAVTHQRYLTGQMPQAMAEGRMSNTVAPSDKWLDALYSSDTRVDTEDGNWTNDVALSVDKAWKVRWNNRANDYIVTEVDGLSLKAGGYARATYAESKRRKARQVTGGSFIVDHIGNG